MSVAEIQSIVLQVLQEVQELSGRSWTALAPNGKPIGDLDGFDSLCGVEATVLVEERLGCRDLGVDSVFVSDDGRRSLTVNEIAHRLSKLLATSGAKA